MSHMWETISLHLKYNGIVSKINRSEIEFRRVSKIRP